MLPVYTMATDSDWSKIRRCLWGALHDDNAGVLCQYLHQLCPMQDDKLKQGLLYKLETKMWHKAQRPVGLVAIAAGNRHVPECGALNCLDFLVRFAEVWPREHRIAIHTAQKQGRHMAVEILKRARIFKRH